MFQRFFKTQKAVEAAGVLLRVEHGEMSYLRLLKLLYIADRESLQETGRPILGGSAVAMDQGPLHSPVYDLVKGARWDEQVWSQHIEKDDYHLRLKQDPGVLALSRYEIRKLADVAERFLQRDDWELVRFTHGFEEWKSNYQTGTSTPISWEAILSAVGRASDGESIRHDAELAIEFENFFAGEGH